MPKKQPFAEPYEVSQARRKRFKELVAEAGGSTRVSEKTGIDRVHIEKLSDEPSYTPAGKPLHRDILALRADTIALLLDALNLSDSAAIHELQIPQHLHKRWTTTRPDPMGGGKKEESRHGLVTQVLTAPLVLTLRPGHLITIDPNNTRSGEVLVLLNGQHHVMPAEAIPATAEPLGQLVYVDALVRRPIPVP